MQSTIEAGGVCSAVAFEPAGFFRLAEARDRWWLVTPGGAGFLCHGINHVDLRHMAAGYNIGHWAGAFGVPGGPDAASLAPGFCRKVREDFALLGTNTLGPHSDFARWERPFLPHLQFVRMVDIGYYRKLPPEAFPDVFSMDFVRRCGAWAEEKTTPFRNDPLLIGYVLTDCPVLTDRDGEAHPTSVFTAERDEQWTWPAVLRNRSADAPGKQAYVAFMGERYEGDIRRFNGVYDAAFTSFEQLAGATDWRAARISESPAEAGDNLAFLQRILDKAYGVITTEIRRCDPNHLILGDVLNGNTAPPPEVVRIAATHFDAVTYQFYAPCEEQAAFLDRIASVAAKPVLHGDSCFAVPDRHMPNPYGPHMGSHEELAREFHRTYSLCFAHPRFLGWNWCGWMDSWEVKEPRKQHAGVQDPFGHFHPIGKAMRDFARVMYHVALGRE